MAINAVVDKESMALNATVEPMLMRDIAIEKRQVTMIELTGICSRGLT